jgi:hypothetical protein
MDSRRPKFTLTHSVLAVAMLMLAGVMACPNTPSDRGDATSELERMHPSGPLPRKNPPRKVQPADAAVLEPSQVPETGDAGLASKAKR